MQWLVRCCFHVHCWYVKKIFPFRRGYVKDQASSLGQRMVFGVSHGLEMYKRQLATRVHRCLAPVLWCSGYVAKRWKGNGRAKCQLPLLVSQQITHRFSLNKSQEGCEKYDLPVKTKFSVPLMSFHGNPPTLQHTNLCNTCAHYKRRSFVFSCKLYNTCKSCFFGLNKCSSVPIRVLWVAASTSLRG